MKQVNKMARTQRTYHVPVWWGWSNQHGWVVLDRTITFTPYLYFVRPCDWRIFREEPNDWQRPRYVYAPNYLKEQGNEAARQDLEAFQRQFGALRPQLPRIISYIERLDDLHPVTRRLTQQLEAHKRRYHYQFNLREGSEDGEEIGIHLERIDGDFAEWLGLVEQVLRTGYPTLDIDDVDLARMEEELEQVFAQGDQLLEQGSALGLIIRRAIARPLTATLHRRYLRHCRRIAVNDPQSYEIVSWKRRQIAGYCQKCHCELDSKHDLECTLCHQIICGCGACGCIPQKPAI